MSKRWKLAGGVFLILALLGVLAGLLLSSMDVTQQVEVQFVGYTNSPSGGLSAVLEVRNRSKERIARNSCRVSPQPADAGYWYAADVPARALDADQEEWLVVPLQPRTMTRWRATVIYVRNPGPVEYRLVRAVDWLDKNLWVPAGMRSWRDRICGGEAASDWIPFVPTQPSPSAGAAAPQALTFRRLRSAPPSGTLGHRA